MCKSYLINHAKIIKMTILGMTAAVCFPLLTYADQITETTETTAVVEIKNQQMNLPGWRNIDGKYYYFRSDGTMATGSMKEGETRYTFGAELGNLAYARREKNSGGGSFNIGFYDEARQALADNLNELKEDSFDGDEDDDYYEDEKVDYDKDASFIISGKLTEIAEHRLLLARRKGYGNGGIPGEGNLDTYVKTIGYNSGRRFMEVYLKFCENADDAEQKLLRSHGNEEKRPRDRAIYYKEIGIAHQILDGKIYYMVIFMK